MGPRTHAATDGRSTRTQKCEGARGRPHLPKRPVSRLSAAREGLSVRFVGLLLLSSSVLLAQPPSPDDGPAALQFASWLALLNKGDRAALQKYHRESFPYTAAPPLSSATSSASSR